MMRGYFTTIGVGRREICNKTTNAAYYSDIQIRKLLPTASDSFSGKNLNYFSYQHGNAPATG